MHALGHSTVSLRDALLNSYASCNGLNCTITVNIIHNSFNLISYRIGRNIEAQRGSLIRPRTHVFA